MTKPEETKAEGQGQAKSYTIVVNGRPKTVTDKEISFEAVVDLAYPQPRGANLMFTVTYRRGEGNKPEGTLVEGESVKVKEGMIFNVSATDKS